MVEDLAGNRTGAEIDLTAGVAAATERSRTDDLAGFGPPPPVVPISQAGADDRRRIAFRERDGRVWTSYAGVAARTRTSFLVRRMGSTRTRRAR